jgi:hypothetical protein
LKQLSVARDERSTTNRGLDATTKQILTQYYALTGQTEKAKDRLRAHVKTDLDLLPDEDLTNDYQGCRGLAIHVMYAGQDDDALAAWPLITPQGLKAEDPKFEAQTHVVSSAREADGKILAADANSQTTSSIAKQESAQGQNISGANSITPVKSIHSLTKKLKGPIGYYCGGCCGTKWTYADDMYVCRQCDDVRFDEHCLKQLRAIMLGHTVCNKNYEILHVPKHDEKELERVGKDNVKVGQKVKSVKDWIQGIRDDWDIPP